MRCMPNPTCSGSQTTLPGSRRRSSYAVAVLPPPNVLLIHISMPPARSLELLPDPRESGTAERPGQRPEQLGERFYLERLIHVDDTASRVPGGVDGHEHPAGGVPGQYRRRQPRLGDGLAHRVGDGLQVIARPPGRAAVTGQVERQD